MRIQADPDVERIGSAYTAGIGAVEDMLDRAESLRTEATRNPSGVVDEDTVVSHIAAFQLGLFSSGSSLRYLWSRDYRERYNIMVNTFKDEAEKRLANGQADYRWWNNFNIRYSIATTPAQERSSSDRFIANYWQTDEGIESSYGSFNSPVNRDYLGRYLDMFPEIVVMPTFERLGPLAFNRTFMTGVRPLRMAGASARVGDRDVWPDRHAELETLNIRDISRWENTWDDRIDETHRERLLRFHKAFLQRVEELPVRQRQMAEFAYYLMLRKSPGGMGQITVNLHRFLREGLFSPIAIMRLSQDFHPSEPLSALLPEDVDGQSEESVRKFLLESADFFEQLITDL